MTDMIPNQIKHQDFVILGGEDFQQQLDIALAMIAHEHNTSTTIAADWVINFVLISKTKNSLTNLDGVENWRIFYRPNSGQEMIT